MCLLMLNVMFFKEKCADALGIENGGIKDGQLTASSAWMGVRTFGPQQARLNNQKWPQGWSADLTDKQPWLKVSLQSDYVITGIATQGYGNPVFREWVESYYLVWLDTKAGEVYYHEDGEVKVGVCLRVLWLFPPTFKPFLILQKWFYFKRTVKRPED